MRPLSRICKRVDEAVVERRRAAFSSGTSTSAKLSSAVSDAWQPIFSMCLPTVKPLAPFSTMNAVSPCCFFSGDVEAMTT